MGARSDTLSLNRKTISALLAFFIRFEQDEQLLRLDCQSRAAGKTPCLPEPLVPTIPAITGLTVSCLRILVTCITITNRGKATTAREFGRLTEVAATCFLSTFPRTDFARSTLEAMRHQYRDRFPSEADFQDLSCHFTMSAIHHLFYPTKQRPFLGWSGYNPPVKQHVQFAEMLAKVAWSESRRRKHRRKVPNWILRFASHSLSQDPSPPTSVVVHCLLIIAIGLGCNVSRCDVMVLARRFVHYKML